VCAEIPNERENPRLFKIITKNNIHGPCGEMNPNSPCMRDLPKTCSKMFPKEFRDHTLIQDNAYPEYRRRSPTAGGNTFLLNKGTTNIQVDNGFVVPFNPALSLCFNCHLNVEVVHTVLAVKYLFKYLTKGPDKVNVKIQQQNPSVTTNNETGNNNNNKIQNEIEDFQNARYISSSEAIWKLYTFPIHSREPFVMKLACHLENQQSILFDPSHGRPDNIEQSAKTTLTEFFALNRSDEQARNKLYSEIPKFYRWDSSKANKKWVARKRGSVNEEGNVKCDAIGRIPIVSYSIHQSELYYLRMLLYHVKGLQDSHPASEV
jgi:hypothetical protein